MNYWINILPKERVVTAVEEGYMESQGDEAHLSRLKKEDMVIFYSPREDIAGTKKLQAFTAVGQIADETVYPIDEVAPGVKAFRRKVTYTPAKEVPVIPLIQSLVFIKNKKHWGFVFKLSLIQIHEDDFNIITKEMVEKQ